MVVGIEVVGAFVNAVGCLVTRKKSLEVDRVKDARMSVPFIVKG